MDELIKFFFSNAKIYSKTKTRVIVDGRILEASEFYTFCLDKFKAFEDYVVSSGVWKLTDKEKADWVRKFWNDYFTFDRNQTVTISDVFEGSSLNLTSMELVLDYHSGKEVVFNNETRSISQMHPKTFMSGLSAHHKKLIKDGGLKVATFSFNPYNDFERRLVQLEGQHVVEINCFNPPKWRCNDHGKLDAQLENKYNHKHPPKIFLEFLEHLFPKPEHQRFVVHWMHQAIFSRNETYLVLNGKKGAGKNLFCDLLGRLVGEDYYRDANQRFFDEGFNSVLDRARLILLDELKVEDSRKQDRLKKYINKGQNIERKGVDADKTIETFNSYIINNNLISDMYLVWDDRRFSVPDITDKRLKDVWGEAKCEKFAELFDDIEFLRELGFWIKSQGKQEDIGKFQWLAGEQFWKIVHNSLTEWQKVIVDVVMSKEKMEYAITDLKQTYKKRVDASKFPFKIQKIGDFLDQYRHRGDHQIAILEGTGETASVVPTERYLPENHTHVSYDNEELEDVL